MVNYYDILHSGCAIKITDPKKRYDSASFWVDGGKVFSKNKEMGTFERTTKELPAEKFNKHIENMIAEGLHITIYAK